MEKTKTPKQIIQSYLEERAKNDPLFASVYAKPNKNINECFDYIPKSDVGAAPQKETGSLDKMKSRRKGKKNESSSLQFSLFEGL